MFIPKVALDWPRSREVDPLLIKHITFTKVEDTAEDVLVILRTLYERAADLGIDAKTRISFHANVLLAGEGGFRPGALGNYLRICIRKLAESRNVLGKLPSHESW
jgi:hypothetical protein